MPHTFTIDLWSDVVCPFCYLGTRQLQQALDQFEHADHVTVRRHAFELDPDAPTSSHLTLDEVLARKYGMTVERARSLNQRMEDEAATYSMTWSLQRARPANTFDAHRLLALAATQRLDAKMGERLFLAYFSEGELLSDRARLDFFASDVGVTGTAALWASDDFAVDVRDDESRAMELGITGVPSFLVDEKFMIVGAQGSDQILQVLRRAWTRRADQSSDSAGTTAAVATE